MKQVATTKLTEVELKKAFRIKLFELCKTTTKQSSPDLFNFYKISAGHDMVNDAGRATTCRRKLKAPWLQTKGTNMKGILRKWVLAENSLKISTKRTEKSSHLMENKTKEPQDPDGKNWTWNK